MIHCITMQKLSTFMKKKRKRKCFWQNTKSAVFWAATLKRVVFKNSEDSANAQFQQNHRCSHRLRRGIWQRARYLGPVYCWAYNLYAPFAWRGSLFFLYKQPRVLQKLKHQRSSLETISSKSSRPLYYSFSNLSLFVKAPFRAC